MNNRGEAGDRLRKVNPLPSEARPSPHSPEGAALFERLTATEPEGSRRPHRRKKLMPWVMIPPVMAVLIAAGYGLLHHVTQPLVIGCYAEPSLGARRAILSASVEDPVAACAALWQPGGELNAQGALPVPALAECVLKTGAVAVFPTTSGSALCADLGLAPFVGAGIGDAETRAVLEVQSTLADQFVSRCVGRAEAASVAKQALAASGLAGWRIVDTIPFSNQEPCASAAYDVPNRTITLIPVANSATP
jgi:hypothetical protein